MNQELKDKWVAALRSGEYTQGVHYMYAKGKYCCLGVLQEVATGVRPIEYSKSTIFIKEYLDSMYNKGILAAMNDGLLTPKYIDLLKYVTETYSSDFEPNIKKKAYTFSEIADHIEDKLPVV